MITALTAVGALVFTGLSLNATRQQVAVAEQSQVTDRYTKAVEQLDRGGDDHLQVRLGAIYGLERLAQDSPRDQPTIIEVLSAFIRTSSPVPIIPTPQACKGEALDSTNQPLGPCRELHLCPEKPPSSDIQAALTVLGRRNAAYDNHTPVDLRGTCLRRAQLHGANLSGARLDWTNLLFADLSGADLTGATLSHTYLGDSNLTHADLSRVDLTRALLFAASLSDATLVGANLTHAELGYAKLQRANLTRADLRGADLTTAGSTPELPSADLSHANLTDARLEDSYLNRVNLTGANLSGADLTGAYHHSTNVTDVQTDAQTRGKWW
ncbi:pentapeptide repeat-containing protein [Lentzea aerocolonigenes]|uniref:pentapeptide repeat-containing protein n=1 Tax=Lentzea aerocolonigenes TaxID=68170 RepID=UPI00138E2B44|nr:pentapeptide repeat-containing protein [Lentzea aerocolonigenes]